MTTIAWICFVTLGSCHAALAQMPVHLEPRHPAVFESDALRVLNVNIEGGDTTLDHLHANDIAIVCISGCDLRTRPVGGNWGSWISRTPGQIVGVGAYAGQPSANTHQAGDARYHVISVENLRQHDWSQDAAAVTPGRRLVNETRAFQIFDLHVAAGQGRTERANKLPVVAILISGQVIVDSGGGREAKMLARPGDWAVVPSGEVHRIANRGATAAQVVEIDVR